MEFAGSVDAESYLNITLKQYLLPEMKAAGFKLRFQRRNGKPLNAKKSWNG
jgi:hypothetical protein